MLQGRRAYGRGGLLILLTGMAIPVMGQVQTPQPPGTVKSVTPSTKHQAAVQVALTLRNDSSDSFRRGLLPLVDHLEHLSAVFDCEGRAAYDTALRATRSQPQYESQATSERGEPPTVDRQRLVKAMQPVFAARIQALQDALSRLEQFNQPAAIGWVADVALARLSLRQAQREAAEFLGDRGKIQALSAEEQRLAAEHYYRRLLDAEVGLASVPSLIHAVALLNVAPEFKRQFYESAAVNTTLWNLKGAEIGRKDAVTQARLDLSWLNAYSRQKDGEPVVDEQHWLESDRLAQTLFEQRSAWYPKGTATLADLSRTWRIRQHIHQIAREAGFKIPHASIDQHERNLQNLLRSAEAVQDLRGRAAADVRYVRVLSALNETEPVVVTGSGKSSSR